MERYTKEQGLFRTDETPEPEFDEPAPEPVPVLLPEPLGVEVDSLLARDRFVEAVRLVRERTQLGLLVATRAVRHRQE